MVTPPLLSTANKTDPASILRTGVGLAIAAAERAAQNRAAERVSVRFQLD
jgi:hypothetical protein